jgi:hypothetical protein
MQAQSTVSRPTGRLAQVQLPRTPCNVFRSAISSRAAVRPSMSRLNVVAEASEGRKRMAF